LRASADARRVLFQTQRERRKLSFINEREDEMSDKDRQKKDGERKDKKNKQMHERENEMVQGATEPQQARDASNLTDRLPGAASTRETTKEGH
jgi:hypothetical protein